MISQNSLWNKNLEEMFTGERLEVTYLNIFHYHICLDVPKEKISKLDPSEKKGIFVGYSEQSKYYIIYVRGFHHTEINKNVTFDEDASFNKSRKNNVDEYHEEEEPPRIAEVSIPPVRDVNEELIPKYHCME